MIFGSIVYNLAIVYKSQNFLKVVFHAIIIDRWKSKSALDEIQVTVLYRRAFLVAVSAVDRGLSVKLGLGHFGHWQAVQPQIRRRIQTAASDQDLHFAQITKL